MRLLLLLLIACGPKTPPEGSTELALEVPAAEPAPEVPAPPAPPEIQVADAPLPLGAALPEANKDNADAHAAFLAGEEVLGRILAMEAPKSPSESQQRATDAVSLVDEAVAHFAHAAELDPTLGAYCAARTGDAWRELAAVTEAIQPPLHSAPEDEVAFRAEQVEAAGAFRENALRAYEVVLASRTVDARWRSHARWAVSQLPEVK